MKPSDFNPMHNGERFQVRQISVMAGRTEWQVYADGLQHIALCGSPDIADMIAECLNEKAEGVFRYCFTSQGLPPTTGVEE